MSALPQYVLLETKEAEVPPMAPQEPHGAGAGDAGVGDRVALGVGAVLLFGIFLLMLWLGLP